MLLTRLALASLVSCTLACAGPEMASAPEPSTPAAQTPVPAPVPPPAAAPPSAPTPTTADDTHRVRQVIDGDTITVSGIGTVRLLGVDAPEKQGGLRPAEPFGDEATRFMRDLVEGQLVRLEYDGERQDPYKRTLAYVILEDGRVANEAIIRAGLAEAYRRFDYWRKPDFQRAEREARAAGRGMWARRDRR